MALKIAIIGAGTWGNIHAAIFHEYPMVKIVAICDQNEERARKLAAQYGIPGIYTCVDRLLADEEFEAVSIVTPDHLHADIAVKCAAAGKHMLIEKPLATTREDVFRIVKAVRLAKVRVMVDLHNRWSPPFAQAKQLIDAGKLGVIRSAYFRLNDIKWVATDLLPWAADSSILWFLGSHSFDTLQWLFADRVVRVYSVSVRGTLNKLGVETDDVFLTTLEFQHGGIAQMENGWITPNGNPCVNDIKCNLCGDQGMVAIDASSHNLIQYYSDERTVVPDILVNNSIYGRVKGFAYESIRSFIDSLVSGAPFKLDLEDAARTSLGILAIMESAKNRMPIDVDDQALADV